MSKKKKFGVPQAVFIQKVDVASEWDYSWLEITEPLDLDVDRENPTRIVVKGSWKGRDGTIAIVRRTKQKVQESGSVQSFYYYEEVKEETEVSS
jgi:hypothetical protein